MGYYYGEKYETWYKAIEKKSENMKAEAGEIELAATTAETAFINGIGALTNESVLKSDILTGEIVKGLENVKTYIGKFKSSATTFLPAIAERTGQLEETTNKIRECEEKINSLQSEIDGINAAIAREEKNTYYDEEKKKQVLKSSARSAIMSYNTQKFKKIEEKEAKEKEAKEQQVMADAIANSITGLDVRDESALGPISIPSLSIPTVAPAIPLTDELPFIPTESEPTALTTVPELEDSVAVDDMIITSSNPKLSGLPIVMEFGEPFSTRYRGSRGYFDEKHHALDITAYRGTASDYKEPIVRALGAGIVTKVTNPEGSSTAGVVEVMHNYQGEELYTRYVHMGRIDVQEGQVVKESDAIGPQGSTGNSTGPHLHLEVYKIVDGKRVYVNPHDYIDLNYT